MGVSEIIEKIRALPPEERREVVERIEIEFAGLDEELSPEQLAELDRRAEEALRHPERGRPVEEVFAEIDRRIRAKK
jgi:putative addiction module component (TIGR02574 family)